MECKVLVFIKLILLRLGNFTQSKSNVLVTNSVRSLIKVELALRGWTPIIAAFLEPVAVILVLTIVGQFWFSHPPLGSSFLVFYSIGFIPLHLWSLISFLVSRSVIFFHPFLHHGRLNWADFVVARSILNCGLAFAALVPACILAAEIELVQVDLLRLSLLMVCLFFSAISVGVFNLWLSLLFPKWDILWGWLTRPLILVSGVFYLAEQLPKSAQSVLWFNPVAHVIDLLREVFYPYHYSDFGSVGFLLTSSIILLVVGKMGLNREFRR